MNLDDLVLDEITASVNDNVALTLLLQNNLNINNFVFDCIQHEIVPEEDVYVNNFFEIVVPQYSEDTYKKHFRMTRNTVQVI